MNRAVTRAVSRAVNIAFMIKIIQFSSLVDERNGDKDCTLQNAGSGWRLESAGGDMRLWSSSRHICQA